MENKTIILRFRDLVTEEGETIKQHQAIINKHGYVWWAWWKKSGEKVPFDNFAALSAEMKERDIIVFLVDSGLKFVYKAVCKDLSFRKEKKFISPEPEKTPGYYRNTGYFAWFKFTDIQECKPTELNNFSYIDCPELFIDTNVNYKKFENKRIHSIDELVQQNRTLWFIRKKENNDPDYLILLLDAEYVQPTEFSPKYYQAPGDTLLWLSDLHLPDNVFNINSNHIKKTLSQHICEIINPEKIAGLLISGDITSCAKEEGFSKAKQLIKNIGKEIKLPLGAENILICPGNHDFSLEKSPLGEKEEPEFIGNKKENAKNYSEFYQSIYHLKPNQYFALGKKLMLSSGYLLEIISLNSLMLQQYPNFEGHGYLSQKQLEWVARQMGWNSSENTQSIRIVMMHHHYFPTCYTENINPMKASSAVYDADRLMRWLVKYNVTMLLHGHKHKRFAAKVALPKNALDNFSTQDMRSIYVIGMGSTGACETENVFSTICFKENKAIINFYKINSDESMPDSCCQTITIVL